MFKNQTTQNLSKQELERILQKLSKNLKLYQTITPVLLIICLLFSYFAFLKPNKLPEKTHQYLDVSVGHIQKKDMIINVQQIRDYLRQLIKDQEGNFDISIYFEFYNSGANISINPDLKLWPASLTKLPVAMVVMKKVESGAWHLDDELVLLEQDIDPKSGDLYKANSVGTRFTIEELLKKLLVDSDNTAYRILYRNIEANDFTTLIDEIGLQELFDKDGKIATKEYSRLLRALYFSTYLNEDDSEKIIKLLITSSFNKYLSSGLPAGVEFSHKYGENVDYNLFSDSGIVYVQNRPYVLSVMMQAKKNDASVNGEAAEKIMKDISAKIYNYVSEY